MSRIFRIGVGAVSLVILGVVAVLVANALSDGRLLLHVDYAAQEFMGRHGKATALDVKEAPGLKMFLHPEDKVVTPSIMAQGTWEPNELYWTIQLLREGDTYVDVGANVGFYTLIAARIVGDSGHVFAFEPDPTTFAVLERNVRLNGLTNVTLEQKAASNANGTLTLYIANENKGDHRIFETKEKRETVEVPAVRLDDYFANYDRDIDFVKIDTQGAEGVIVEGMLGLMRRDVDMLIAMEFSPNALAGLGTKADELLDRLIAEDYLFFNLGPGLPQLLPLTEIRKTTLLQWYPVDNEFAFTNLLMVRGREQAHKLGMQVLKHDKELYAKSPEIMAAQAEWESRVVALADAAPGDSSLPPESVLAGLRTPANARSEEQLNAIHRYFAENTPLLAGKRAELASANSELDAYFKSIWTIRGRNPKLLESPQPPPGE